MIVLEVRQKGKIQKQIMNANKRRLTTEKDLSREEINTKNARPKRSNSRQIQQVFEEGACLSVTLFQ